MGDLSYDDVEDESNDFYLNDVDFVREWLSRACGWRRYPPPPPNPALRIRASAAVAAMDPTAEPPRPPRSPKRLPLKPAAAARAGKEVGRLRAPLLPHELPHHCHTRNGPQRQGQHHHRDLGPPEIPLASLDPASG
ncbi:hypothetical protein RHMOL_Rhmol01G0134200 [Rhododendron molle]|uniref:Uncharacterized protein n=1 Tax=Rhododendron molle TaxID=49168 RepID=A0ACC0Q2H3_RHOML|nr:hypothetical protein RHMOL_Rhmol01G0134200 [Rhododendron molle]